MTDIDVAIRRLSDLEAQVREQGYRIKALEKWHSDIVEAKFAATKTWGSRAPDCPSHKTDPMGR